jgi:hypothetical protein
VPLERRVLEVRIACGAHMLHDLFEVVDPKVTIELIHLPHEEVQFAGQLRTRFRPNGVSGWSRFFRP